MFVDNDFLVKRVPKYTWCSAADLQDIIQLWKTKLCNMPYDMIMFLVTKPL